MPKTKRRGRTAAAMKEMRRKYRLGEFSRGRRNSSTRRARVSAPGTRRVTYSNAPTSDAKVAGGSNLTYDVDRIGDRSGSSMDITTIGQRNLASLRIKARRMFDSIIGNQ